MKIRAALLLAAVAAPALAQTTLWDNGPFSTGTTTASNVPITNFPGGSSWSEVMFDGFPTTCPGVSNTTAGFNGAFQSAGTNGYYRVADDFTLASRSSISEVVVYTYMTNARANTPVFYSAGTVSIHDGRPGDAGVTIVAGDDTTNRLAGMTNTGVYRVFSTVCPAPGTAPGDTRQIYAARLTFSPPIELPAGTYWASVNFTAVAGAPSSTWILNVTTPGTRAPALPPPRVANARQLAATVWQDMLDTANPATGADIGQEMAFLVRGEELGGACDPFDLNNDDVVDFNDYLEFLNLFNAEDPRVDYNGDMVVDFNDYLEFLNGYNACQ